MIPSVKVTKRAIDILSSSIGLLASAPLMPLIALAIYVEDKGPILYKQRRAGMLKGFEDRDGLSLPVFEEFDMFKFRSMRIDAEKFTGAVLAQENDPRITRVGRFLRKSRLDELPQLMNILRGEMSLVGPRPERPELLVNLALAIPFFEERMRDVKPGLTGLAQVSLGYTGRAFEGSEASAFEGTLLNPFDLPETEGSTADDMRMKLLFDLAYAAALEGLGSFLRMELGVIFKTPWVMVKGVGR
ncbi:MAG: sugar transferase [Polyangiaceae bacterium]|nr:sugar transferase [Polyangiaceae bacterium]MBK8938864.1 sugar transferase [Polyangiaceae bacterium]